MTLAEIINKRRSIRKFDINHDFDHAVVTKSLELTLLSPNSSNLQTWEFYRIKDKNKIKSLVPLCLNQNAARTASELVVFVSRKDLWKKRADLHLNTILNEQAQGLGDEKKHQKGIRYYKKSIPFLYKAGWLHVFTVIRWAHLVYQHIRGKYLINWVTSSDTRVVSHKSIGIAAGYFMLCMTDQGYDTCPMEGIDEIKIKKLLHLPSSSEISMIIACGKGLPEGIYYERKRLPYDEVVFEI